jgi:phosphoglycerate kinase
MNKRTVQDLPRHVLDGARVLMRVDYNVPLHDGTVADDARIRATPPTLRHLLERDAAVVLLSHLGRPKGKWAAEFSLAPAATCLDQFLEVPIRLVSDIVGSEARDAVSALKGGEVLVLENTRFLPGEETNDPQLSEQLAAYGAVYVNDAFGTAHRAHASTVGAPDHMKREGKPVVAGLLMEAELRFLGQALERPDRPFVAVLGGAKISGKIDVIENLLPRVDRLIIGGAMANTFFRAMGLETGTSLVEEERVEMARTLLDRASDRLVLPVDGIIAEEVAPEAETRSVERDQVPPEWKILDIGPRSVSLFRSELAGARTILWNGPMGIFEMEPFRGGTDAVARAIADATRAGATTIIGGGDTAAAVREAGLEDRMTHVSTGGGASLEFLEGRTLPGVAVLDDREA